MNQIILDTNSEALSGYLLFWGCSKPSTPNLAKTVPVAKRTPQKKTVIYLESKPNLSM